MDRLSKHYEKETHLLKNIVFIPMRKKQLKRLRLVLKQTKYRILSGETAL